MADDSHIENEWFDANRRMWDERVPIHVVGDFYDVEAFKKGGNVLRDFEIEDVGDVTGRSLVHLQCHFGLDTLSWARLGAAVTGLDFSAPAIDAARSIAAEIGVEADFEFGNVYDAPGILGRRFEVVYTGLGALCWLPDIERWADIIAALTEPGGTFYLSEFHPLSDILGDDDFAVQRPYFHDEPQVWDEPGTYADLSATTTHDRSYEWTHPISEVFGSLLLRGFVLEKFRELDWTLFPRWPFLEKTGRDRYDIPDGMPRIPLMYAARFRLPRV